MHSCFLVPDETTTNVDDSHGIQFLIGKLFPPEASAFASIIQVTTKANIDESLQAAKRLTSIGVTIVIRPSQYRSVDLPDKFRGLNWGPSSSERPNLISYVPLGTLTGKDVDSLFATARTASFDKLKTDKIEALT